MLQSDALEVCFVNDVNVYFVPILKTGLAVRHVALLIRRLFKFDEDVVLCKPLTTQALPGSLMLLPGRAVTVYRTLDVGSIINVTDTVTVPDTATSTATGTATAIEDDANTTSNSQTYTGTRTDAVPNAYGDTNPNITTTTTTATTTTATATAVAIATSTTHVIVTVDGIVDPVSRRGIAAFCVCEPIGSACRDAIKAREDSVPTLQFRTYNKGAPHRNAAACELEAALDALTYAVSVTTHARIRIVCPSTYVVLAVNKLVRRHGSFVGENADGMYRLQKLCASRDIVARWSGGAAVPPEPGCPSVKALRRYAVTQLRFLQRPDPSPSAKKKASRATYDGIRSTVGAACRT
jgi:hypothetical protein